jgi:hypothetical protein
VSLGMIHVNLFILVAHIRSVMASLLALEAWNVINTVVSTRDIDMVSLLVVHTRL